MPRTPRAASVLDASVVLAVVFGEPGGDLDDEQCRTAVVNVVNAVEVEAKLLDRGLPENQLDQLWATLGIRIVDLSTPVARRAAVLVSRHRRSGLSLGDCVCLATGAELAIPVLTADQAWTRLPDLGIDVRAVR